MIQITMMAPTTSAQLGIWVPAIDVFRLNHSMTFALLSWRGGGAFFSNRRVPPIPFLVRLSLVEEPWS